MLFQDTSVPCCNLAEEPFSLVPRTPPPPRSTIPSSQTCQNLSPETGTKQGMFWDGFQWIPTESAAQSAAAQAVRKMKRLYIGNVPSGCTDEDFRAALIEKMREQGMVDPEKASEEVQLLIW